MLNSNNERELAYVVTVKKILPMNADRLECIQINGWNCVCAKNEFNIGDLAVFFEIDSRLPEVPPFSDIEFLKSKHYSIKSQKIRGVVSQGLLLPISAFNFDHEVKEGDFLTKELNITYYIPEDNGRKSNIDQNEKYNRMSRRHPKIFKLRFIRWLMKRSWGKELLFIIFGKKRDKPLQFPTHFQYIKKTDEERVENIPWILTATDEHEKPLKWIKTTKIDGTSATYILERKKFGRYEFYVTSRNVRQMTPEQKNYHDTESNVYWDMALKYNIEGFLKSYLEKYKNIDYICIQGEIAGPNIQGNPHKLPEVMFYGFNLIDSITGRWNSIKARAICEANGIMWVPIVDIDYELPKDMEEFKLTADGECEVPNSSGLREGYVYRSKDGKMSFKNVSRQYLLSKGE